MKFNYLYFDKKTLEFKEEVHELKDFHVKNGEISFEVDGKFCNSFCSNIHSFVSFTGFTKKQKEKIINYSLKMIEKYTIWLRKNEDI